MKNELTKNLIDTRKVFIGEISSKKYVCEVQDDGSFLVLETGEVIPSEKIEGVKKRLENIKPCKYYHENIHDIAPKIELLALQDVINNSDYMETHNVNELYLRQTAGVCRYVNVASSMALFKRVLIGFDEVFVPVNHSYSPMDSYEEIKPVIEIIRPEALRLPMRLDEVLKEIRDYELGKRIFEEENKAREEAQNNCKKSLFKTIFKR